MANTFEFASDPMRLADLEEKEGRTGLSRLAEYFSNAGEPMPPALQTALAVNRSAGRKADSPAAPMSPVTNFEDRGQLAGLVESEGPQALLRQAQVFEAAGKPLPLALSQALIAKRGDIFSGRSPAPPSAGVMSSPVGGSVAAPPDAIPLALARSSGVLAPLAVAAPPSKDWTKVSDDDLEEAYFAEENPPAAVQREYERRGRQLAIEERAKELRAGTADEQAMRRIPPWEYSPSGKAPASFSEPSLRQVPVAVQQEYERREGLSVPSLSETGSARTPVRPPAVRQPAPVVAPEPKPELAAPLVSTPALDPNRWAAADALQAQRDVPRPQTTPALPLGDVAQGPTSEAVAKIAKRSSEMLLASPIPTASAPSTTDAPEATAGAIAPTGPQTPAGTPDSAGAATLPAPSSPGAGDDVLGRLSLGQALVRALEGSGSVIAGRDLRSGTADTLGERMRQIEALRAKRQEQAFEQQRDSAKRLEDVKAKREDRALELAREDEQSAAIVEQYKSLAAQGLVTPLEGLDRFPVKQAAALIKTYASLPGTVARTDKTRTEIPLVQARTEGVRAGTTLTGAKTKTEEDTRGARVDLLRAKEDAARAQAEKLRRHAVVVKQASDTKAASDIRAAGNDARAAEKAITRAMETAETDKLGIAANIRDFQGLESVAPGFTRGVVPSWLGQGSISAARSVPATSAKAAELSSALETFIAGIRKSLFGASLTGNEKASFDAIVSSGLLMPPAVLAANINRLRAGAARFAQNHFTVAQELHPEVTGRVLKASSLFGPAVAKGGIYSDVWTLPKAPAAGGASSRQQKPQASEGYTPLWNKSQGKWQEIPNEKAEAAKVSGRFEE